MNSPQPLCHLDLVRAAVLAPSPDNNQPWRFAPEGDRLLVYLDPSRALPSDVNSMFDLMGLGAAVENAAIAGRQQGYEARVDCELGGSGEDTPADAPRLAATMTFQAGSEPDPLHPHLGTRCTNRRLYSRCALGEEVLGSLAAAASRFPEVQLDWIPDRKRIRAFARVVASSDRFRFLNAGQEVQR